MNMNKQNKQLLLNESDIKLIFEQNREFIGKSKLFGFDSLIAGIGFLVTVYFSVFKTNWMKYTLLIIGIIYLIWGGINIIYSYKHKFNKDILYQKLEEVNLMEQHQHSIILIKDTFNKNPNRFLVYQDARWGCRLFINFHSMQDNNENIKNIEKHIQSELKTQPNNCVYLFDKLHTKFSVSAGKEKYYKHSFYELKLQPNKITKQDSFTIDGKTYYWMSIAEMENDKNIMDKNSDIVKFVKEANV